MLKKLDNPITWRDYFGFAAAATVISVIISLAYYLKVAADWGFWPFGEKEEKKETEEPRKEGKYIKI